MPKSAIFLSYTRICRRWMKADGNIDLLMYYEGSAIPNPIVVADQAISIREFPHEIVQAQLQIIRGPERMFTHIGKFLRQGQTAIKEWPLASAVSAPAHQCETAEAEE